MTNETKLIGVIKIEGVDGEVWEIEQDFDNKRFYIISSKGYNGYEGDGFSSIVSAINHINKQIKNYYSDRCLEESK